MVLVSSLLGLRCCPAKWSPVPSVALKGLQYVVQLHDYFLLVCFVLSQLWARGQGSSFLYSRHDLDIMGCYSRWGAFKVPEMRSDGELLTLSEYDVGPDILTGKL